MHRPDSWARGRVRACSTRARRPPAAAHQPLSAPPIIPIPQRQRQQLAPAHPDWRGLSSVAGVVVTIGGCRWLCLCWLFRVLVVGVRIRGGLWLPDSLARARCREQGQTPSLTWRGRKSPSWRWRLVVHTRRSELFLRVKRWAEPVGAGGRCVLQ